MKPVPLAVIHDRVDKAIADGWQTKKLAIGMCVAIFALGFTIAIISYWTKNAILGTASLLLNGLLYWPLNKILQIWKEELALKLIPALISTLPQEEAARQLVKTLDRILGLK